MERRKFTREFKFEAVRLIRDRGVSYAQASEDLKVHPTQLRNWVKAFADDPQHAFPGQGQMKPERLEIARLKREVIKLMADHGIVCSMSRSGNVCDNAAMESFFSSLKTERTARKIYRSRDEAKADVFDYIERFYNPKRRHSTIGYMRPMEFERQAGLA
jgi:transposase-like protein